jgi:hypothetical protein
MPPFTVPSQSLPCQPCHVSAMSACATCHPYSGDMCHPLTGPIVYHTPHHLPHQLYDHTTCIVSLPRGTVRTVRTVQSSPFFACLGFQTECDIFHIRSPFDEVNIWLKSGRRDERNGTGFVRFRALSFLSLVRLLDLILDHTSPLKYLFVPKRLLTSQEARDRPPNLSSVSELCPVHLSHQDQ